jgi:EmrB/QacA subfamily drug resistance transporter
VTAHYTHRQILKIMTGLLMALLTSMISTSVVSTALPTIVGDLGGQDQLAWVASAALLTMTASTPLWGKLSDLFGRKLMFQTALIVFVAGSIAAGLSQNIGWLIAARAVQGLGTGGLSALTQVILGDIVEPRERGRYSGFVGAVFGVSTVAGPLLGGFIVDTSWLGWRWCFYVCVPLAIIASIVIQRVLKLPRQGVATGEEQARRESSVDWFGAFTITGAAATVMLLLSLAGKEFAWDSPWTYGLAGLSLVLLALAVVAERTAAEPILPPRLFGDRTFALTALASLFVGVSLFGVLIFLPQYLQIVKGMRPTASGLMTLPLVLGLFVASTLSGRFVTKTGRWKIFPALGMLCVAIGLALLTRLHVGSGKFVIGLDIAVVGVGLGLSMQILILAAQNASAHRDLAATTSGVSFFRNLGGAVGVAAFGAILTSRLSSGMADRLRAAHLQVKGGGSGLGSPEAVQHLPGPVKDIVIASFTDAMHMVFLVGVPVAVAGFLAVLALKERPLRSAPVERFPAETPTGPQTSVIVK